jgi:hypothetical protein
MTVTGGLAWTMASQLIDVANELPNYKENINAKNLSSADPPAWRSGRRLRPPRFFGPI